jgi:hypothetical protein
VTKFVGKFRKHKDYRDDCDYAKNYLHNRRVRSEHTEIRKQLREKVLSDSDHYVGYDYDEDYDDEE